VEGKISKRSRETLNLGRRQRKKNQKLEQLPSTKQMFGRPGLRQRVGDPRLNKAEMTLMAWGMVATPWISMSSYGSCACSERKNSWETRAWFQLIGTWVLACTMQHVEVFVSGCHNLMAVWTVSEFWQSMHRVLLHLRRSKFEPSLKSYLKSSKLSRKIFPFHLEIAFEPSIAPPFIWCNMFTSLLHMCL